MVTMDMGNDFAPHNSAPLPGASGGCAMAGACLFVLAAVVWPLLFLVGNGIPEPEALLIPIFIGGPAFLAAHIFAVIDLRSSKPRTAAWGSRALRIVWGSIVLVILLAVVSWLRDPESWTAGPEPENSLSE
jgi:hypothetical protein